MLDADRQEAVLATALAHVLHTRAQVRLGQHRGHDALHCGIGLLRHQRAPARIAIAAQRLDLGRSDPQPHRSRGIGIATVDRAVALQQHEHQQLKVALGQRLEPLHQRESQEFIGEPGGVLEFDGLHWACPGWPCSLPVGRCRR